MSNAPLVAVVTPVYNGEPWLERTLANVQLQTYPNLVHIVLDNASTDGTAATIARFANQRIPLITRRNPTVLPQTVNWNAAFALTPPEARYVKLNCADDLMRPDAIAKLVAMAETDPEIDYVFALEVFDGRLQPHGLNMQENVIPGREYGRRVMLSEVPFIPSNHAFFRADPAFVHSPFDERLPTHSDKELVIARLLKRKMGCVFEPLFYTHSDNNTITAVTGWAKPPLVHSYREVMDHGAAFLTPEEMETAIWRRRGAVLRHLITWIVSGDVKNCALAYQVLAKAKHTAALRDFAQAILDWPRYKAEMRQATREAAKNPRTAYSADYFMTPMSLDDAAPSPQRVSG